MHNYLCLWKMACEWSIEGGWLTECILLIPSTEIMRWRVAKMIRNYFTRTEEGFHPSAVEASSDPRSSRCKNRKDWESIRKFLHPK